RPFRTLDGFATIHVTCAPTALRFNTSPRDGRMTAIGRKEKRVGIRSDPMASYIVDTGILFAHQRAILSLVNKKTTEGCWIASFSSRSPTRCGLTRRRRRRRSCIVECSSSGWSWSWSWIWRGGRSDKPTMDQGKGSEGSGASGAMVFEPILEEGVFRFDCSETDRAAAFPSLSFADPNVRETPIAVRRVPEYVPTFERRLGKQMVMIQVRRNIYFLDRCFTIPHSPRPFLPRPSSSILNGMPFCIT
ncbi:hypothetical protein BHE74_00043003, partial [Ensete ventricosum]